MNQSLWPLTNEQQHFSHENFLIVLWQLVETANDTEANCSLLLLICIIDKFIASAFVDNE